MSKRECTEAEAALVDAHMRWFLSMGDEEREQALYDRMVATNNVLAERQPKDATEVFIGEVRAAYHAPGSIEKLAGDIDRALAKLDAARKEKLLAKTKTMTAHIDARLTEERLKFEALQELDEVRATLAQRDEALARVRNVLNQDDAWQYAWSRERHGPGTLAMHTQLQGIAETVGPWERAAGGVSLAPAPAPERSVEAPDAPESDWHQVGDGAFARPFGTVRVCVDCGCLVAGGPTRCARCARDAEEPAPEPAPKAGALQPFFVRVCELLSFFNEHEGAREYPSEETLLRCLEGNMRARDRELERAAAEDTLPDAVKQVVGDMVNRGDDFRRPGEGDLGADIKRWASTLSAALGAK